jgi:hypothetical protein
MGIHSLSSLEPSTRTVLQRHKRKRLQAFAWSLLNNSLRRGNTLRNRDASVRRRYLQLFLSPNQMTYLKRTIRGLIIVPSQGAVEALR